MADWKGAKQNSFPGKASGKVDWKGAKQDCNVNSKDYSDKSPKLSSIREIKSLKSTKMGKA